MSILWKYIPPLASDYSGIASVLYGMNSLNILYSPGSCDGPIVEVDEIRNLHDRHFFTTKLNDIDIVVGIEERLVKMLRQKDLSKFDFVSISGTPITNITGVSLERICLKLEKEFQIPVIYFETSGFESYPIGISKGILKLAEKLIDKFDDDTIDDQINILGYSPLILGDERHLSELIIFLNNNSFAVNVFGGSGFSSNSMVLSSKARLNLVISEEGVELADLLKAKYGIPYILGLPVGITGMNSFFSRIEEVINISLRGKEVLEYSYDNLNYNEEIANKKVLIIGEPFVSLAIKNCLQEDFSIKNVSIISDIKNDIKSESLFLGNKYVDVEFLEDETGITEKINSAEILIADPIYERFLSLHSQIKFIHLPHIGLSGREFAHIDYEYIGINGFNYLKTHLEDLEE